MSKKTKKSVVDKSVSSGVMQQQDPIAPTVIVGVPDQPSDPSQVPFPEWNDQDVNSEKWEPLKTKSLPEALKQIPIHGNVAHAQHVLNQNASNGPFVDIERITMPYSLDIRGWLRPAELFPNETIIVYEEFENYPDLLTASTHIVHIPIYRDFISAMGALMYLGDCQPWPFEVPSATFYPVTEELPWRPYHHIYSIGKAGKGIKHNPQINSLGKYIVRLFWMGCWRKVYVDDLLPIDHSNHVLLPSLPIPILKQMSDSEIINKAVDSSIQVEKKDEKKKSSKHSALRFNTPTPTVARIKVNIWPFLLCKAILKLASFSSKDTEIPKDFDIISCFTGWTIIKLNTKYLTINELWETCSGYTNHYTWESLEGKPKSGKSKTGKSKASKSNKGSKTSSKSSKSSKTSSKSSSSKKKKGTMCVPNFLDEDEGSKIAPFHLVAVIKDMRGLKEDEVMDLSPCWSHSLLLHQSRDIPLIRPEPKPELEKWKRFRWIAWAVRNGIYIEDLIREPLKCFKIISTFKKFYDHIVYAEPSEHSTDIKLSVDVIENIAKHNMQAANSEKLKNTKNAKDKGKAQAKKSKSKDKSKNKSSKSDKKSKSSSKSSKSKKSSKGSKGKKSGDVIPRPPDPSFWSDFIKIAPYITYLYIYVKPSQFLAYCRISDLLPPPSIKPTGKATKGDKSPKGKSANIASQQIAPQAGYTSIIYSRELEPMYRNKPIYMFFDSVDTKYVVLSLSQVGYNYDSASKQSYDGDNIMDPHAYVMQELFKWNSLKIGVETVVLKSMGHKGLALHFDAGRIVRRLWIKSNGPFVLLIMSDTPICVGTFEVIIECMAQESQLVMQGTATLSKVIGQALQSFGTPQSLQYIRDFYKTTYDHMRVPCTKRESLISRQASQNAVKVLLLEIIPIHLWNDCFFALSVLYRDPLFNKLKEKSSDPYVLTGSKSSSNVLRYYLDDLNEEDNFKRIQRAASKIQAFFKRVYVQNLMALHQEDHPRFRKIYDSLKYVYNIFLSPRNRHVFFPLYIRKFLFDSIDRNIAEKYYFFSDMLDVVSLKHLMGTTQVAANSWSLICKYTFYVTSLNDIKIRISLHCNLNNDLVRVIDNDTQKDVYKYINTSKVSSFRNNLEGYTVICYGWSRIAQIVTWKTTLATLKMFRNNAIIIQDTDLMRDTLYFLYRPNVHQRIFHCLVNIKQSCYLTFRLSASSQNALLNLKCIDPKGKVMQSIISRGSVILPNMKLLAEEANITDDAIQKKFSIVYDIKEKDSFRLLGKSRKSYKTSKTVLSYKQDLNYVNETSYVLEAYVVDNSWTLNTEEWGVVDNHKLTTLLHMREYPRIVVGSRQCSARIGEPHQENILSINESGSSTKAIIVNTVRPRTIYLTESTHDGTSMAAKVVNSKGQFTNEAIDLPKPIVYQKRQMLQGNSEMHTMPSDIQAPYWCLQTFFNKGDSVTVCMDTKRELEIKAIKENWYRDDPERYERSQELRNKFLNDMMASQSDEVSFTISTPPSDGIDMDTDSDGILGKNASNVSAFSGYIPWNTLTDYQTFLKFKEKLVSEGPIYPICQDKSACGARLLMINCKGNTSYVAPDSFSKNINLIDLSKYMTSEKVENLDTLDRKVLTQEDWEEFMCNKENEVNDFEDYLMVFREDMDRLIGDEMATNVVMNNWIQGIRDDSEEMMKASYKLLDDYSAFLIQKELAKRTDGKDNKKSKAKGKGKGKGSKK